MIVRATRQNHELGNLLRLLVALLTVTGTVAVYADEGEKPVERNYVIAPPSPQSQTAEMVQAKSAGCISCHTASDRASMHQSPAVRLGCTDCHGGDATVVRAASDAAGSEAYTAALERAHVLPMYPESWHESSANPEQSYTLLNRESPEFVRFMNPSDYRVAHEACGACHQEIIEAAVRSMHSTGAMLWGGASYNNGILPFKDYILGESYNREGEGTMLKGPTIPEESRAAAAESGVLPELYPLPAWETVKPGDIFRVFERGGRNISNLFPETGLPNSLGQLQRIEEPGRPDIRQSNRGPGTGARIAVPVINITKTRLNDPLAWFMGTNDQPGDYRNSGCASCHVVYANDRDPRHAGVYAQYGHDGTTITVDPTIAKDEPGHPLQHAFTRAVPTSQCMICHMHQPNMFMNTFLGYTMWDYESDAPIMWPEKQQYPTAEEMRRVLDRNPEGASTRGKWADLEFLKGVSDLNPQLKDTQFADYHGHGWNFRAVFKRDRKGNLLDADGKIVSDTDPNKFDKAVHMSSVHLDVGMQCVDCHWAQDNHGNGHIYGEVALAVEVDCRDCHGSVSEYPNLYTSGPAALGGGTDMSVLRTPDGRLRFEWRGGALYQRSMMYPDREWKLSLVKDSVDPTRAEYNAKAARAKLMSTDTATLAWGGDAQRNGQLAHGDDKLECYSCHTSWTTSCGGCHLPIEANWKTERHHYEGGETRNYATYNPQVARDEMFLLGRQGPANGGRIAPVRSSSALVLSSTNANRERIYIQQPPIAASGFSSQAFNPHYPHTERKTETKTCTDCHLSQSGDNNAIMAQLLMLGTNFINFVGLNAWVGGEGEVTAVQVTEWDEPQAVIGSYLHKYAYPDWFAEHEKSGQVLQTGHRHAGGVASCLQLRGEYLYVAEGKQGLRVYDVASVANKGVSQRFVTSPFSVLGQDTLVQSKNATCVALPTNQPINPARNEGELMRVANQEQPFHPLYNYAFVTDAVEGLILVNVNTLVDGEPRNNDLERALTWNENGVLNGARHVTVGGHYLYIVANAGLVVVDIDQPLAPRVASVVPLNDGRASALQFRYLFVTDADGLKVVDVTHPDAATLVPSNVVQLKDAHRVYVARTYAYVAAGSDGLVIVDVERPEAIRELTRFNGGGALVDSRDVIVATTNASLFAYVADGAGGLKVVQLTSPDLQPKFYGFSPEPNPQLIASYPTRQPALSLSKGLDRDRGVDETGGQIAVFGRQGARPLNLEEMQRLFLDTTGKPWYVSDEPAAR
jgi:hypothetical protein